MTVHTDSRLTTMHRRPGQVMITYATDRDTQLGQAWRAGYVAGVRNVATDLQLGATRWAAHAAEIERQG